MPETPSPLDLQLADGLGVGNGPVITPIPPMTQGLCTFSLLMWSGVAFNAKLQISPDSGTTWIDYPNAALTATGMRETVYIGAGIQVRLNNTTGPVSASLVPLP